MRLLISVLSLGALSALLFVSSDMLSHKAAQSVVHEGAPLARESEADTHQIRGVELIGDSSGVIFTAETLLRTEDGGRSWRVVDLPKQFEEALSDVEFADERVGFIAAGNRESGTMVVLRTVDGGLSWTRQSVRLNRVDREDAYFDSANISLESSNISLSLRLASTANFVRISRYNSVDSGKTWKFAGTENTVRSEAPETKLQQLFSVDEGILGLSKDQDIVAEEKSRRSKWILTNEGVCEGFKTGCLQITKLFDVTNGYLSDITPHRIAERAALAMENARETKALSMPPPGGSTRISLNRGFDKCTAATATQMQTWWNTSPFYDVNIYISGRNRGCSQAQLTSSWVNTVSNQGWGLIPTIVGYQSPCSTCTTCAKHSSDSAQAEIDGRGEADIAITDATNLGLLQGTVLYYDMERYDDTSGTGACSTPTKAFLKGWTDRLKERGYVSGTYGSPTNAMNDWVNIPEASRMSAVWLARWDGVASVWVYSSPSPTVPETAWGNHQRIKQYQGPANFTFGGVTFNIDSNIADGPVAGVQSKNRRADFDGDGKSDFSVWRPENGAWYTLNSSDSAFKAVAFGASTDVLTPGDFDGDGRTDIAVWRPSDGIWHIYSRSIYWSYPFGMNGDIPVPSDYDGDGRTDIAVYRPSNGMWYIRNSFDSKGTSFRFEQFGAAEDSPIPGDFDGDGRSDLAVFRPSNGVWYMMGSSEGFSAVYFGMGTDKLTAGDFDGDGKTDQAVFRDGVWHILGSRSGYYGFVFGFGDDKPIPGDFDGDGKTDVGVFRPSTGTWYILGSTQGFFAAPFGLGTDKPIQGAYLPRN